MQTVAKKKKRSAFADRLRELRKTADFTQAEVAKRLRVGIQTYMRWERGETEPTVTELGKIATMFGKTPNDFYPEGEGNK